MSATILVADDEEDILGLLRLHLTRLGYEVVTARDGEEALRLAEERRPALAVLDVSMPKLDGLEVTRRLREAGDLPVILLSALVQPRDVERGLEAGARAYLRKPFTGEQLREQVEALLG
jgi:two-component system OmpR family response regulator